MDSVASYLVEQDFHKDLVASLQAMQVMHINLVASRLEEHSFDPVKEALLVVQEA